MADWSTISSLATAAGTLVLAAATFVAVRSAHTSARITERALMASIRPLLVTPRMDDPPQKVGFSDDRWFKLDPGRAAAEVTPDVIYLAFGVRNVGSGLAMLDCWNFHDETEMAEINAAPDLDAFRRLTRDLYIAPGDVGFWQGAFRDPEDPEFKGARRAIESRDRFVIDVLYGDAEGGQRTVSRFVLRPLDDGAWYTTIARHWNIDRPDPR